MADTFLSYAKSDRDWAFWIAKERARPARRDGAAAGGPRCRVAEGR
jgi:hypothetical protein